MKRRHSLLLGLGILICCVLAQPIPLAAARGTRDERLTKRVNHLQQLLTSERFSVRAKAAELLGTLGAKGTAPDIYKLLTDNEVGVRQAAVSALGKLHYVEAMDDLVKLLQDGSPVLQLVAVEAIGEIGREKGQEDKATKALIEFAGKNKNEDLLVPLGVAMGKVGDKKLGTPLFKVFEQIKDKANQCKVAAALGRINGEAACKLLEELHGEPDMRVKYESMWAAGTMNNKAGYDWLMKRMTRLQSLVTPYDDVNGVRDAFSTAVGNLRDVSLLKAVLKECQKDPKDLLMALRGLGRSRMPELYDDLKNYLSDSNEEVQVTAVEACGLIRNDKAVKQLLENLKRHSFSLQIASIAALGEIAPDEAIDPLLALLEKDDWRIRYAAARSLVNMRCEDLIEPFIKCMYKSSEWLQKELGGMLREMTGKDNGADVKSWDQWWTANKDKFEIQYEEDILASDQTMTFYGLEINSNKVLFCLDRSGSMALPASDWVDNVIQSEQGGEKDKGDDLDPKDPKAAGKKKKKGSRTKMEALKAELVRMVKGLKPSVNFNLYQYSSDCQLWKKEKGVALVSANDATKDECLKYIEKMSPGGGTAIYDVLKKAFLMAAGSIDGKDAELEKLKDPKIELAVDTIFLMTDGTPMGGQTNDIGKILEDVQKWNSLGRIRVHSVGVGEGQNVDFLRKLAAQNGGKYAQH